MTTAQSTPGDVTLSPPPRIGNPVFSVITTTQPYVRIGIDWDTYPGAQAFHWYGGQGAVQWRVQMMTTAWLAGTNHWEMPSLTNLPGWDSRYAMKTGTSVGGYFAEFDSTGPITDVYRGLSAPGTAHAAYDYWSITP